jgi:2-amino-4-hydroxy-6-hydroxymethyldihydropteridine diphosphokinase
MTETALSLGSNLGDRLENLKTAKQHIASLPDIQAVAQSAVYETEPVNVPPEFSDAIFLNSVLIVNSSMAANDLFQRLRNIELGMGRTAIRTCNTPRIIDIDIIYSGSERVRTQDLVVPHPRWAERNFVVEPLHALRPDLLIPGEARTVREVFLALPATPKVLLFSEGW